MKAARTVRHGLDSVPMTSFLSRNFFRHQAVLAAQKGLVMAFFLALLDADEGHGDDPGQIDEDEENANSALGGAV